MNSIVSNYLKICGDIGGAQPIPELLSCLSAGVKACSISSPIGSLTDGQVIALCAVLPLADITELTLHDLGLNINSWVAMADACTKCKALQKLYIRDCAFAGQGVATFARALGAAQISLLDVANCRLGDDFAISLAEGSMLRGEQLQSIRLVNCHISDDGACRLAKSLEAMGMLSNLKTLDLSFNRIGDKGACALAAMLISEGAQSSLPLQALELEGNTQMTDVGCLALARAAKGALVLSRLNISMAQMTDATLHALAEALRFNTGTLKEVAVAGARASEEAAVALIRAAMRNNSLQLLDLRGIPLGNEGVTQLCQMLRYTGTLSTLRVDVATREGGEAIARELPNNRSLMHLTLGGPVDQRLIDGMNETLGTNTMRAQNSAASPARSSPAIHAWIENATLGNAVSGHTAAAAAAAPVPAQRSHRSQSRSTSPGPGMHSPRSNASGSVYSAGTYTTQRTATSYLSFQFSQMSRKTGISSSPLRLSSSLAAGGAAEKAAVIFRKHDLDQDNHLNRDEMLAALHEVGIFNGIRAKQVGRMLESEFKKADWDNDNRISLKDFTHYYEKVAKYQANLAREGRIKSASHHKQSTAGIENNPAIKRVFRNYCKYALGQGRVYVDSGCAIPHMNAQQFARLCADGGFMEPEGRLTTTAIDVIFYRFRPQGGRRLGFKEFVEALAAVAYEAGMVFEDVMVALGCREEALDVEGSELGGEARHLPEDPSFSNLMAPGLSSIQEVPTPLPTPIPLAPPHHATRASTGQLGSAALAAARIAGVNAPAPALGTSPKKKKKVAVGTGAAAAGSTMGAASSRPVSNPLYESQGGAMLASAVGERFKAEMDARMASLEARLAAQVAMNVHATAVDRSGGSITGGGFDASVTASSIAGRLSRLEAQLSQVSHKTDAVQREEMEGVVHKTDAMQAAMQQLMQEMSRLRSGGSPGVQGGGDTSALYKQVEALSGLVGALAGDVRSLQGRADGLSGQVASLSLEQRTLALQQQAFVTHSSSGGASSTQEGLNGPTFSKLLDRQTRFEGALMQVARQVDVLDARLREDQDTILAAGSQGGAVSVKHAGTHLY